MTATFLQNLLGRELHWMNGSPVKSPAQTHIGVWLTVLHSAFLPHDPGQGSRHFWLMQACWLGHSLLLIHSGLHLGGVPINWGKHEHDGAPLRTRHIAFGPQGEGWQGSTGGCDSSAAIYKVLRLLWHNINYDSKSSVMCVKSLHCRTHWTNGSPVYKDGQLHIGLWFTTLHCAINPHAPRHGSMHFWLLQALLRAQSVLMRHSGLQDGGAPLNPAMHAQIAWPFDARQWLFGPHGDGLHGCSTMVESI